MKKLDQKLDRFIRVAKSVICLFKDFFVLVGIVRSFL